jgi:hypothetical protein
MKKTNTSLSVIFVAVSLACANENITTKPSRPLAEFAAAPAKYAIQPEMQLLRFGEIRPHGWLREQMRRDLESGFAGHMQEIASNTANSDIFTTGRKQPNKLSTAGTQGWWNGETEGNWRSGNTMMTLLAGTPEQRAALDACIVKLLKFQDSDGYMGIYVPESRWKCTGDSGELWTQACLFRGLIAYYEATGNATVLDAVERAVQLTIRSYGTGNFSDGQHSLMFVDVTERLYDLTGNPIYRDFGLRLCRDMLRTGRGLAEDMTLSNLLDPTHFYSGHGVTQCESFRLPAWAASVTGSPIWLAARDECFSKALRQVSPTGAPIASESMGGRVANPDTEASEGCAMKEWMTSVLSVVQKVGDASFADHAEDTFFNSVQGARLPDGKGMSYCNKDNCYDREGELGNRIEYSPCHEDVANCCAPNFTLVGPIFVRNMWMRSTDGLAAVLYGPCETHTTVNGMPVTVTENTRYPFENQINLTIGPEKPTSFTLRLRVPGWCKGVAITAPGAMVVRAGVWMLVTKTWVPGDNLAVTFKAQVQLVPANNKEFYLRYGPLFYAYAIPSEMKAIKNYALPDFHDYYAIPMAGARWNYALAKIQGGSEDGPLPLALVSNPAASPNYPWDTATAKLTGTLINQDTGKPETIELVPMGCGDAKLRRCTFPWSSIQIQNQLADK